MNIGLIIIGDEILSGKRVDKHLPKVIELLAARGLSLAWARYVGDDPQRITADLQRCLCGRSGGGRGVFLRRHRRHARRPHPPVRRRRPWAGRCVLHPRGARPDHSSACAMWRPSKARPSTPTAPTTCTA